MSSAPQHKRYPDPTSSGPDELRDSQTRARIEEDAPSPMQIEIYRRMTPGRRLEIAEHLYWGARALKTAWVRSQNPAWTDEQVESEVKRIFSDARS